MLGSCNFPLLVNSGTPLQKGVLLTSWLFGFAVVESAVAVFKETYPSAIKLCEGPLKHQKRSSVSWSHSSS